MKVTVKVKVKVKVKTKVKEKVKERKGPQKRGRKKVTESQDKKGQAEYRGRKGHGIGGTSEEEKSRCFGQRRGTILR